MRGVQKINSMTVTSSMLGKFIHSNLPIKTLVEHKILLFLNKSNKIGSTDHYTIPRLGHFFKIESFIDC